MLILVRTGLIMRVFCTKRLWKAEYVIVHSLHLQIHRLGEKEELNSY